jgi:hypothetical protein
MSSLDNIYIKMEPTVEPSALASLHPEQAFPDNEKIIGRQVAHELNNILTILRGYAERLMVKHGENSVLRSDLQLINENVRRAEHVVRQSTPKRSRMMVGVGV